MRHLMIIKLNNDSVMHIVINASDKKEAKQWAIKSSMRLFGDSNMYVTSDSKVTSFDEWRQERQCSYQDGNKQYYVAFFMDNITQLIKINAAGAKSAYNNVKIKYGIQDNFNAMVYELNQNSANIKNKISAMYAANELLKDSNKLNIILYKSNEKVKTIPLLSISYSETVTMFNMIKDFCSNKYTDINTNKIIVILGCILYFLNSDEIIMDVNDNLENLDGVTVFAWILKQCRNDIMQYGKWASCKSVGV